MKIQDMGQVGSGQEQTLKKGGIPKWLASRGRLAEAKCSIPICQKCVLNLFRDG